MDMRLFKLPLCYFVNSFVYFVVKQNKLNHKGRLSNHYTTKMIINCFS